MIGDRHKASVVDGVKPALRIIVAILIAYAVACAVVVVIYQTSNGNPFTPEALGAAMAITTVASAPGFALLRMLLWAGRSVHALWFTMTGALNGVLALCLFMQKAVFDPYFALMGLAAGAVYWLVERAIAGEVLSRNVRPAGEQV